ncbi:MAG: hypothetical protein F6K14_14855 [Symploca sp. SIO2C1]|nr:hypothetical protein [Symploca sp. SIO2C1]
MVDKIASEGGEELTLVEKLVLRGCLDRQTYKEIAANNSKHYSYRYIQNQVGPNLWTRLTELFGEKIKKKNCWDVLPRLCENTNSTLPPPKEDVQSQNNPELSLISSTARELDTSYNQPLRDWSQAPDISGFYGRQQELEQLEQKILDGCRLITLFGTVGVGKTWLAVKLAQRIRDQYHCLVWRSLEGNPPPLMQDLLKDLIQVISGDREETTELKSLVNCLLNQPCLIILDGFESVLESGVHDGSYRSGYEDYGEFLRSVSKPPHQSCVVLTSSEDLQDIKLIEISQVMSLRISGFGESTVQKIYSRRGLHGSDGDWRTLSSRYQGNPRVLNAVARDWKLLGGNITMFLHQQHLFIPDDIRDSLAQQFQRLSQLEQEMIQFLAVCDEPALINDLLLAFQEKALKINDIYRAFTSLRRRDIIQEREGQYFLQRLMAAYIKDYPE